MTRTMTKRNATDIVRAINDEDDYKRCRNYWKYLKGKMAKNGIQVVSVTHDFKFQAPDGKQRFADALDAECVQTVPCSASGSISSSRRA